MSLGRFDERAEHNEDTFEAEQLDHVQVDGKSISELLAKIAYNNPLNP